MRFNFNPAAADEDIVYGSERPGYPSHKVGREKVLKWIRYLKKQGVKRICCLLTDDQLKYYEDDLLDIYNLEFGKGNICTAQVEDFQLADSEVLDKVIFPFLQESLQKGEPAVVHCSGGIGRTGHILAAWLVHGRGYGVEEALAEVIRMGRNPFESVEHGTATKEKLLSLLESCKQN